MDELTKEATKQVLAQVPVVLRALIEEREKLASRVAELEKQRLAEDIVSEMDDRGFTDRSTGFKQKVAALLDSGKDLDLVKEALSFNVPNLSFASVSESGSIDPDDFESYILNG